VNLDTLRAAVRHPLARDVAAQRELAVLGTDGTILDGQERPSEGVVPREASVLVIVYPTGDGLATLLTLRTDQLPEHAGQISFPGGSREPDDTSLLDTALRETEEEIGVDRATVEVLGELAPVWIPVTGYRVLPWVAVASERPKAYPDPVEVAEILDVSLTSLLARSVIERELWTLRGREYLVPFYRHDDHKIWGATGRIVAMLTSALRAIASGHQ